MINLDTRIETKDDFVRASETVQSSPDFVEPKAYGLGVARMSDEGQILDVRFPVVNRAENTGTAAMFAAGIERTGIGEQGQILDPDTFEQMMRNAFHWTRGDGEVHSNVRGMDAVMRARHFSGGLYKEVPVLGRIFDIDDAPANTVDAWLRLNLLSRRKALPNELSMEGLFGKLTNVHWTNHGPVLPEDIDELRLTMMEKLSIPASQREVTVRGADKFPHMLDYVPAPEGVRIADATRVRLGAYLGFDEEAGEGTTVMHEGFVNANAGTQGSAMVEGRISFGVVVGNKSDIGGGASTQGVLSGGGKERVSIGERCLIEANAGVGISLGDDCRVEAGLYVKSTTPVLLPDGETVKAAKLSGKDNMMLRRNASTGTVELVPNSGTEWGGLNSDLHTN